MLKSLGLALCLAAAAPLVANVYYVNKGVRYHIGNNRFSQSTDSNFMDTYPTVGLQWIQAFTVNQPDDVKVHIDMLWGIDDCPYCKDMVTIESHDMGRLSAANNHEPFETLEPLAYHVEPGHVYYLKIESFVGKGQELADNFVFEGLSVETEHGAKVTYVSPVVIKNPEQPAPTPVPARGPCEGVRQAGSWLPVAMKSRGNVEFNADADPVLQDSAVSLAPGDFVQIFAKVEQAGATDRVSQALEVLLGDPSSGWVFSFPPAGPNAVHGNMTFRGHYMASVFSIGAWKSGAWNEIRVARCTDGRARLWLNGQELGTSLDQLPQESQLLKFRALGVTAHLAEQPY